MPRIQPKRRLPWLYIVLLIVVLGSMWLLRICRHSSGSDVTDTSDTVDVAIQYAPLSFYQVGDTLGGFNYDLLRAIGSQGGIRFKFHPVVNVNDALDGLDDGVYDMVVADIPATLSLAEGYSLSEPVYLDRLILVQRRDTVGMVSNVMDLRGKEVHLPAGSTAAERLRHLSEEIGDTIIVHTDSVYGPEQLFLMVATGDLPMAVINERTARSMAADYPGVDISTVVSFNQFQSWLLRGNDTILRQRLDTLLVRFKQTAMYQDLSNRYL